MPSAPRTPIVAGNWKMHLDRAGARGLAAGIVTEVASTSGVELVLCPPAVWLDEVRSAVEGSAVMLGGQNASDQPSGAFTGEISLPMLVAVGCRCVILGHSERRTLFCETDAAVNAKARAALAAGLTPIVCLGETLAEREAGRTADVVATQARGSLAGIPTTELARVVVAYEPVWAIGTGRVATPQQAQEVHGLIREVLAGLADPAAAAAVRIQYGGSVKPDNAAALAAEPDIDGALVGGASLKVADFLAIARAFVRSAAAPDRDAG